MASKTILLVDDDPDDTEMFKMALQKAGSHFTCHTADNGEEALTLLRNEPDLPPIMIFMDVSMPVMNGFECLAEIKKDKRFENIPVVVNSVSNLDHYKEKCRELGAHFMVKDINFEKYCDELTSLIKGIDSEQPGLLDDVN